MKQDIKFDERSATPPESVEIQYAMALTREVLRNELNEKLEPIQERLSELPDKEALRELVEDKTKAMKGELLAWILGAAVLITGIVKLVPSRSSAPPPTTTVAPATLDPVERGG